MSTFWKNKTLLVTAGPTQEPLDPVRYLTNRSSGKMGYAIAEQARQLGAEVWLVSGPVALTPPQGVTLVPVLTALDMQQAVFECLPKIDILIGAAAVADYRPQETAAQKLKKSTDQMTLTLVKNPDIVANVAAHPDRPFVVGFAAETEHAMDYAQGKLLTKNLDMICVNDVSDTTIGFDSQHNALTLLSRDHHITLPKADKQVIAQQLLQQVAQHYETSHSTENS